MQEKRLNVVVITTDRRAAREEMGRSMRTIHEPYRPEEYEDEAERYLSELEVRRDITMRKLNAFVFGLLKFSILFFIWALTLALLV